MNFFSNLMAHLPEGLTLEELRQPHLEKLRGENPQLWAILALADSGKFDSEAYNAAYPDVRDSGMDPVQHFILHGLEEGRSFTISPEASAIPAHEQEEKEESCALFPGTVSREHPDDFYMQIEPYDVISFDIFDTALLRNVEFPAGIFALMAIQLGWGWFSHARPQAERDARELKFRTEGHTEITISEIYDILAENHGLDKEWMDREIELEMRSVVPNPYILEIYKRARAAGKTVIFCSDMYLPSSVLSEMLKKAGFDDFDAIYVSNELQLHKGDGGMQRRLLADFMGKSIIHIGDNKKTDIEQSKKAGLDAIWHQDCRIEHPFWGRGHMTASILNALINNHFNTGVYKGTMHYSHGYRCGGPLAAGYCQHINDVAKRNGAQKILFLGRDCYIVKRIYDAFYSELPSEYVEASRIAMLSLLTARNTDFLLNCYVFRHWDEHGHELTLEQLLRDTGYEYLAPLLGEHDLNRFEFCCNSSKPALRRFLLSHRDLVEQHNQASREAGRKYLSEAIGDANSVIVADLGWSCTCFEALRSFAREEINPDLKAVGTAICASQSDWVADAIQNGRLYPWLAGPGYNNDIHHYFYAPDSKIASNRRMALEYLFTSPDASLLAYALNEEGKVAFVRDDNEPDNRDEIAEIQQGMYDFCKDFTETLKGFGVELQIPPHVAHAQLTWLADIEKYARAVYGRFYYDSCTLHRAGKYGRQGSQYGQEQLKLEQDKKRNYVLLTSPEMAYTGALFALLRIARAFRVLGLEPIIWTEWDGPFRAEFEQEGIPVLCVKPAKLKADKLRIDRLKADKLKADKLKKGEPDKDKVQQEKSKTDPLKYPEEIELIRNCRMALCNTILSNRYVEILREFIPVAWVIHEAQNLPSFTDSNPERLDLLRSFNNIWCVSEYAREALSRYTSQQLRILPNSVPDESAFASGHAAGSGDKVRFAQLGTMEYRKGYDVALKAWRLLPAEYRAKAELHFAGRFIASAASYCQWLFQEMEQEQGIIFHGEITDGEKKTRLLSDMDVVLVASRDESCSLVALEGAMLGKPLLVTENVGAKYLVSPQNGRVIPTGDPEALAMAMMEMIDMGPLLAQMGKISREHYERKASIAALEDNIRNLAAHTMPNFAVGSSGLAPVIVSLTSHAQRLPVLPQSLASLLEQDYGNFQVELWLSEEEFPFHEAELPAAVLEMRDDPRLSIRWCAKDLGPHKKYYYAMQAHPDSPVIIVDDDRIYDPSMVSALMESYSKFPDCVSCHAAHVMQFNAGGRFSKYENWPKNYRQLNDRPSLRLLPVGGGGVLYPPHCLPEETFDSAAISAICRNADDLWLKMMAAAKGIRTVCIKNARNAEIIPESEASGLYNENVKMGGNDRRLSAICSHMDGLKSGLANPARAIRNDIF